MAFLMALRRASNTKQLSRFCKRFQGEEHGLKYHSHEPGEKTIPMPCELLRPPHRPVDFQSFRIAYFALDDERVKLPMPFPLSLSSTHGFYTKNDSLILRAD
jgi:hypothetical protein